jgi:hypothetical protein
MDSRLLRGATIGTPGEGGGPVGEVDVASVLLNPVFGDELGHPQAERDMVEVLGRSVIDLASSVAYSASRNRENAAGREFHRMRELPWGKRR